MLVHRANTSAIETTQGSLRSPINQSAPADESINVTGLHGLGRSFVDHVAIALQMAAASRPVS
jgi:hypothetical protein